MDRDPPLESCRNLRRGFVHWVMPMRNDAPGVNGEVQGAPASDARPRAGGLAAFERLPFAGRALGTLVVVLACIVVVVALVNFILAEVRGPGGTADRVHDTGVFFAEGFANAVLAGFLFIACIGVLTVTRWGWWLTLLASLGTVAYDAFRLSQSPPFGLSYVYPSLWPAAEAWSTLILSGVTFTLTVATFRIFNEALERVGSTGVRKP